MNKSAFQEAAEAAKRELYPELYFDEYEYQTPACRVCKGVGMHTETCALKHPDGKAKAKVEDLLRLAGDAEKLIKKPEVEVLEENPETEKLDSETTV